MDLALPIVRRFSGLLRFCSEGNTSRSLDILGSVGAHTSSPSAGQQETIIPPPNKSLVQFPTRNKRKTELSTHDISPLTAHHDTADMLSRRWLRASRPHQSARAHTQPLPGLFLVKPVRWRFLTLRMVRRGSYSKSGTRTFTSPCLAKDHHVLEGTHPISQTIKPSCRACTCSTSGQSPTSRAASIHRAQKC